MPPQAPRLRGLPPTLEAFQGTLRELHQRAGEPSYREMSTRAHYSASTLCRVLSAPKPPSGTSTMGFVYACRGDLKHWGAQWIAMQEALRSGTTVTSFTVGEIAPPWPDARVQSQLLALFDRHMAVSLSTETLARSLSLVYSMVPPSEWTRLPRRLQWIMLETLRFLERASTPQLFAARMREAKLYSGLTLPEISERTAHPSIRRVTGRKRAAVSTLSNLCNPRHGRFPTAETLRAFLMAIGAPEQMIEVWEKVRFIYTVTPETHIEEFVAVEEWIALVNRYQAETPTVDATVAAGVQANIGAMGLEARSTVALPPPRTSP